MFDQMWKSATYYTSPGQKMGGEKKTVQRLVGLSLLSFGLGGLAFGFLEFWLVGWLVGWSVGFVFRLFI